MKPRDEQGGCIISDDEREMALRRMMREQFAASEPAAQSWQKLHNRIMAAAPLDPRQEVQARTIHNPLAWVNLFVPRVLQTTFALVFMLAVVLNGGPEVAGFSHHNATGAGTNGNGTVVTSFLDDRTVDPPVRNDPIVNQRLQAIVAGQVALGSNEINQAEKVRPQVYYTANGNASSAEQRVNGDYMLQ